MLQHDIDKSRYSQKNTNQYVRRPRQKSNTELLYTRRAMADPQGPHERRTTSQKRTALNRSVEPGERNECIPTPEPHLAA